MRRSGRSMNRKDRDRGAEMRLTERTRKLIPETRRTERSDQLYIGRMMLMPLPSKPNVVILVTVAEQLRRKTWRNCAFHMHKCAEGSKSMRLSFVVNIIVTV